MPGPGRPFPKGTSGNPSGRPRGANSEFTAQFKEFSDKYSKNIVLAIYREGSKGNMRAAKIIAERELPPLKQRYIQIDLPEIKNLADVPKATGAVMHAVADGMMTPDEGEAFLKIMTAHVGALVAADHASRLDAIEDNQAISKQGDGSGA